MMTTAVARPSRQKGESPLMIVPSPLDSGDNFASFYRRELAVQVRRATLLVGDSNDARDLVHDAFVEVYRRWATSACPVPT